MLLEQKQQLASMIEEAARSLVAAAGGQAAAVPAVTLDRPKQAGHGDLASSVALQIAKVLKMPPRQAAERIADALRLRDGGRLLESVEIAGPGFINLRLTAAARRAVIERVLQAGTAFGHNRRGGGRPVLVEFVSANPTGPLHVGHGRQGALGDALCALLAANGWAVQREFYYNDAGAQIHNLALSVQARARGIGPDDPAFPIDGYRGLYILDIAQDYMARATIGADRVAPVTGSADPDDLDAIRRFAIAYLRCEQDLDLQAFGVMFDNYFLESSLYADGKVDATVAGLVAAGKTFEEGGALWLRTTEYGDDKNRVMRKSDGGYTYFVPDVAYHVDKWRRGFVRAINVQGSDHHGTVARVRAGLQALAIGIPAGYPDYVLHKMVTVMKGGQEVKISKRAGAYVTLRDLIEWSGGVSVPDGIDAIASPSSEVGTDIKMQRGRDAVRFFLISRKADTEFVFDVDLALAQTDENPVYYVQYAHARVCSVFAQALARFGQTAERPWTAVDLSPLTLDREYSLMACLAEFPELLKAACDDMLPHAIVFYLKDLASELHSYYNAERFLVDDEGLRIARLALLEATRQVIANGLALLGVSAPERM